MTIFGAKCRSKMHDGFKVNESLCMANSEQQYVLTIIKIFENETKSWRLNEKFFIITCQFYSDIPDYHCAFAKSTSYYAPPLITPF